MLVLLIYESSPGDLRELLALDQLLGFFGNLQVIPVHVIVELVFAQNVHDFNQLIKVVRALEECVDLKNHSSHGAADTPNVQRVVVQFVVGQQLGRLVVSRCHSHVVLLLRMVELGKTPIDEPQFFLDIVDDDIKRLDVSMHDSVGVRELEGLEHLKDVKSSLEVGESGEELLGLGVVHVLVHETRHAADLLLKQVNKLDNVWTSIDCLADLDLSVDLLLLDGLEDLDHALEVVGFAVTKIYLGVLASAKLVVAFVVVNIAP